MAVEEFHSDQEAGNEESTLLKVDPYDEEEEETLSLCDLPIYSGSISDKWGGDFSKEDEKSFGDDGHDDNLFEFFSEEFTTSSNCAAAENIIFCGKLIPFKDIPPRVDESNSTARRNVQKGTAKRVSKGSKSFACDYTSMGKVSLVRCTTKSRWFLFMFGMSKLSSTTEMELRDIKNRQSRRGPAAMFPSTQDGEEEAVKGKKRSCKGMWKILKSITMVLGCRSSKLANDVVKAALV